MLTVEQLRSKLKKSKTANKEAKKNQAQQGLEIKKLKVALANETVNVRNAREAKQEAFKER